jgi:hypothetical protein
MGIKITRVCDLCKQEYVQSQELFVDETQVFYDVKFVCSDCIIAINKLSEINSSINNGRGILCVRDIISYLNNNDVSTARLYYEHDGDKIASYPKLQMWFEAYFGCRTHGIVGCKVNNCRYLREITELKAKE